MPQNDPALVAMRRTVQATLDAVIASLTVHAETASDEIKEVAKSTGAVAVQLAKDFASGNLSADMAFRGLRKLELSAETAIARIARREARAAAKATIGNILSGALGLLGAIF